MNVNLGRIAAGVGVLGAAGAAGWALAAHPPALPGNITPAQAAAWTIVSRAVLNLDETITKE